jgi:hypothetical protein
MHIDMIDLMVKTGRGCQPLQQPHAYRAAAAP